MADVSEFSEPLESNANGPESDAVPEELLAELPDQFRDSESPMDSESVEASEVEAGEELEEGFEPDDEEVEEVFEEEPVQAAPKGNRAQERIRKLANQRNEAQAAMQQAQQQAQQQVLYAQQMAQQQAQQMQAQYEASQAQLQSQLDMLTSKREQEEEANLSPMEQYERKILRQANEQAQAGYKSEVAELRGILEAQKQQQQEATQAQQRQQRYEHYTGEATRLRNSVLLNGMEAEDIEALGSTTDEMLLAFSAAYGIEPEKAAPHFQRFLTKYSQANLKRRSKVSGKQVRKSQGVPGSAPTGRTASTGNAMPNMQSLRAAGFNSHLDWMAAGEPSVPKV